MNTLNNVVSLESKIDLIKLEIENKQNELDSFEYEVSESDFNNFIDEVEEWVKIGDTTFYPSDILKYCDPTAYYCAKADYESNIDLDDIKEYNDLKDELKTLESELEDLESELEEIKNAPVYKKSNLRKMTKQAIFDLCVFYELIDTNKYTKDEMISSIMRHVDNEMHYKYHYEEVQHNRIK